MYMCDVILYNINIVLNTLTYSALDNVSTREKTEFAGFSISENIVANYIVFKNCPRQSR